MILLKIMKEYDKTRKGFCSKSFDQNYKGFGQNRKGFR